MTACDNQHQQQTGQSTQTTYSLRFGHDMAVDSAHHVAALRFAELVEQRSQGQLKITVHPAQSLGNDYEMIAMAQLGQLDIILPPTAKLSSIVPAFQIMDLPFLFNNRKEAYAVLDGSAGHALFKKLQQHGLTGVSFWESGFKQITLDRALRKASDFRNLKFRVMRSGVLRDQFRSWGAESIAVEFGKTRQALADGVVNGQENPLGSIFNMKFHEVQSHLILSNHGYLAQALVMSNQSLARLPLNLQEILLAIGREVTTAQRVDAAERETVFLEKIKQSDIRVLKLNNTTRQQLKYKARTVMEKHRMLIGTEVVELALQTLDERRKIDTDKLVIALDADLAGSSAISGLAIRRGIEMAIHEINSQGGVLGRKLQLLARDNSMVSARGLDNLQRFVKIPNLVAVFGGISSPVVLSELEFIHKEKILFLDPWAAATHIIENNYKPSYVFRVSVRDEYAAKFLLHKASGISSKVALLLVNNEWGRSNYAGIKQELNLLGIQAMVEKWFDWSDNKLDQKLDEIANSGAKVIIYVGNVVEAARVVKHMDETNMQIPIISHWGIAGGDLLKLAGSSLDKANVAVLQTFSFINNREQLAIKLARLYKQLYAIENVQDIVAPVGTAHAYDITHLLVKAIRKAGRFDMPSIRNAMENLGKHRGLVRTYNPAFTANRHDALSEEDYFLAQYKNGILVPVE